MLNSKKKKPRPVVVLLVEDDREDQKLAVRAFEGSDFSADLRIVSDGEEAMDYLLHQGDFADPDDAPKPDLVLLDLGLPKLDGRGVLKKVRDNPMFAKLPIVVLTTSNQELEVLQTYDLGCDSFITKPLEMDAFVRMYDRLEGYRCDRVPLRG